MSEHVTFVWDERLAAYDFGPSHPLAPVRVELAVRLCDELGLLDAPGVDRIGAEVASDTDLAKVHTLDYVAAVRRAGAPPPAADLVHGLGTPDDPVFVGMHEASALVAGATLAATRAVISGKSEHGVNLAGGLHHAMPSTASGFCIYNDPAVAISWALENGSERVVYVDLDVHHGDGVQAIFWNDPRVLTISLHESGRTLFPGTGFPAESGGPAAAGMAVNVALPAGTGDAGWLRAFEAIVPPLVQAFEPDLLVSQHGCDGHLLDPLAHLRLTVDGQRSAYAAVHELAHRYSGGRWVCVGGGGYEHVQVVPRAWAHLVGIAVGMPVDPATPIPTAWAEYVRQRLGRSAPSTMTDAPASDAGKAPVPRPDDPVSPSVDEAIRETRAAVFGLHGLAT
jgi:acetoin utilization protein AcuC